MPFNNVFSKKQILVAFTIVVALYLFAVIFNNPPAGQLGK